MGILDLFRKNKDEVHGAKVLVCAIDNRFEDLLKADSDAYSNIIARQQPRFFLAFKHCWNVWNESMTSFT